MQRIEVSAQGKDRDDVVKAVALLRGAQTVIADRSAWTKKVFARDRHSRQVSPISDRAVRFCAAGAIVRADHEQNGTIYNFVKDKVPFDVPAPVEIALDALMVTAVSEVGLVLVRYDDYERVAELLETMRLLDPEKAEELAERFPIPADSDVQLEWHEVAMGINDLPEIRHEQMLRALGTAADQLEADLARAA